jgi:hypothetical protein
MISLAKNKVPIIEPVQGFTERDTHSKAILNTDVDSLLKYKIQKRKFTEINKGAEELSQIRNEVHLMKTELSDIKRMLLQITNESR